MTHMAAELQEMDEHQEEHAAKKRAYTTLRVRVEGMEWKARSAYHPWDCSGARQGLKVTNYSSRLAGRTLQVLLGWASDPGPS